ncbi:MAG: SDR family NAD(P)-dependent oxidoreductase [Crocinitomicaceae bacterium]|nr:SDR family NAD(P)-dependent oxidoreductase [Crocinitomicaceae bacterium]
MNRPYALITGASSGIGLEIAKILGKKGYNLFLVSNQGNRLNELSEELSTENTAVKTMDIDLSSDTAAQEVYSFCKENNLEIEVLVNNAGFFFFDQVAEADPILASKMVHLHVLTTSLLCTLFGKEMKSRKKGYILNTSSISAYKDFPGIAYYGSSKSYIKSFTRSLRTELKRYGINVTCLLPGATATDLYDPNIVNVPRAKKFGIMLSAEFVARKGVRALFRNHSKVVPGLVTKLMNGFSRATPHWMIYLISKKVKYFNEETKK